jgi:hypothetical protein
LPKEKKYIIDGAEPMQNKLHELLAGRTNLIEDWIFLKRTFT